MFFVSKSFGWLFNVCACNGNEFVSFLIFLNYMLIVFILFGEGVAAYWIVRVLHHKLSSAKYTKRAKRFLLFKKKNNLIMARPTLLSFQFVFFYFQNKNKPKALDLIFFLYFLGVGKYNLNQKRYLNKNENTKGARRFYLFLLVSTRSEKSHSNSITLSHQVFAIEKLN